MSHTFDKTKVKMDGYTVRMMDGESQIGTAAIYFIINPNRGRKWALLEDVMVSPDYRGQGIGTELVKQIIEIAKSEQCYKIIADSRFSREKVHSWYEKLGFAKHGFGFRMDFEEIEPQK